MSQGGYGGGYGGGGGGWGGQPPGGYGQPPGGYGPPPGGYGQPPGGYGPPPQGTPPGWGPPPGQPPGWGPPPSEGPMRFVKDAVIGGVVGGFLSAVPLLGALNCCFCLLNMVGSGVALGSYLRSHPNENVSAGDAALCGLMSGAIAGFVYSMLGFVLSLAIGPLVASLLSGVYRSLPPGVAAKLAMASARGGAGQLLYLPFTLALFAAFGALGAYLAMQMFFKERLAQR